MAGTQNIGESSDNPVAINVTAMVDVIFCLCIFFMCSFHFKQLEGKIESWLPKDISINPNAAEKDFLEEIRVILLWDARAASTVRKVGNRPPVADDKELVKTILDMAEAHRKLGKKDFPVLIDADRDVPWEDVVKVMDLCKREKLERIEFTGG
jgi:biopolymer transport protein ExbD